MTDIIEFDQIQLNLVELSRNDKKCLSDPDLEYVQLNYRNSQLFVKLLKVNIHRATSYSETNNHVIYLYLDLCETMRSIIVKLNETIFEQFRPLIKNYKHANHYTGHDSLIGDRLRVKILMNDVNIKITPSGKRQCEIYDQTLKLINQNPMTIDQVFKMIRQSSPCSVVITPILWIASKSKTYGLTWRINQVRLYARTDFLHLPAGQCTLLEDDETINHHNECYDKDDIAEDCDDSSE